MTMNAAERMNLMRFVCSFVWTDLRVAQSERDLVMRIAGRMALSEPELAQVSQWLRQPPAVDDIDPTSIPRAHRALFLQAGVAVIPICAAVLEQELEGPHVDQALRVRT